MTKPDQIELRYRKDSRTYRLLASVVEGTGEWHLRVSDTEPMAFSRDGYGFGGQLLPAGTTREQIALELWRMADDAAADDAARDRANAGPYSAAQSGA